MHVQLISCWFATSYGSYTDGLRRALERRLGEEVGVVASNCGCGDPMEVARRFQDRRCEYFEHAHLRYARSPSPLKRWVRLQGRELVYRQRARHYLKRTGLSDVVHFQQTLNAFGSVAVFNWLALPSRAARVVTVHELDPHQQDYPESAVRYAPADGLLVHEEEMRSRLVSLGVDRARIDVIPHGVELAPVSIEPRAGLIYYGGHKLHTGKGLGTVFAAMAILKSRLGAGTPTLTVHGHYGATTPEAALRGAREAGVEPHVRWLNELSLKDATAEYRRARVCLLPYTGSFAGFPAALALASGVPVVATRRAGLPEHLGDAAVWVAENEPGELAAAIEALLDDDARRAELAARGRERAEKVLSWDAVAEKTVAAYEKALAFKRRR